MILVSVFKMILIRRQSWPMIEQNQYTMKNHLRAQLKTTAMSGVSRE